MNADDDPVALLRAKIRSAALDEVPQIVGDLAALAAEAFARLAAPPPPPAEKDDSHDRLLSVEEVAERLGKTTKWVRAHQDYLPKVRMVGRRLHFSERRLDAMIKRNGYW